MTRGVKAVMKQLSVTIKYELLFLLLSNRWRYWQDSQPHLICIIYVIRTNVHQSKNT